MEDMSPRFLSSVLAETTPKEKESKEQLNFEKQHFINSLFRVEFYQRKPNYSAVMELKLSPPMDQYGQPILMGFVECPILFRMTLVGRWALQLWVESGDVVRIIGTFCKENDFHLLLDDNNDVEEPEAKLKKASMVIVEPHILIPTTQIVKAFPCTRKAYLSNQFKGIQGDINYALVLGNVIHAIF